MRLGQGYRPDAATGGFEGIDCNRKNAKYAKKSAAENTEFRREVLASVLPFCKRLFVQAISRSSIQAFAFDLIGLTKC